MRAVDRLHDAHRLSVLHDLHILDTDAEPAYDDLARLASICCDSKIAAVNFVDDERHWTKAIVGVEDGQGASLSAALSFCAATVASAEGQLSVPDTRRSERWRSHPLVAEGPVGFYAGASIVVADEPIAVVCVFGDEPRALGEREEQALRAIARQASAQLELRMRNALLSELAVKDPLTFAGAATTFGDMRALARSQELLEHNQLILDAAGDGICGLNRDGVVTFANPAAAALTGYAIDELIGRNLHATIHHSRADGSPYPYEECPAMASLRDGTVHHVDDDVYWSKDGSGRPVESTNTPIVKDGAVTGAVLVFKDITERKAAGAALQASEHRIRQILQTAHDAFFAMDCDGLITDWNPQAQASFGWSRDEVLGRDLAETIVPERDRDAHRRGLARFVATGKGTILGQRLQLRALHRDGHELAIELTISPLQSADGWSFNAFARDITERNAAEQLLERQRQQLIEAQSVGGFGSWEWDLVTDTVEWSDELCRIYGMKPGCHPRSLLDVSASTHPDDRDRWQAEVGACLTSGEPLVCTRRIVRPDGSERVTDTRGEIVYDEHGKPLRLVGTGQDITERYELERAKDEFTSVVSHELRTPLTSIRGSLGLLESGVLGKLPAQGQRMVEIAVQNTDRLVRLINDILDIERINSGQIDMHPQSCDARELIDCACDAVTSLADAANVSVVIEAERVALSVDADRIIQTLTNLISNAVKFSPPDSSVHVSCSLRDAEVLFEVSDDGRGIPAENLDSIFGRFAQVDASDSREKGGTGLGLAICRSIVDQHGGRIWAQSEPGQGATFSFVLPAPGTGAASGRRSFDADALEVVADPDAPLVLVCDDDPCVIEMVSAVLLQRGYRMITAGSGEQAVQHAIAQRPDAILLDLLMAGTSGWETAAALKRHGETCDIPLVILSVLAQAETEAPDGHVVDWVQKPLDDVQLLAALEHAVAGRDEPFKVLVVEDDDDLAGVLTASFDRHGIQTFHAADGAQAILISQRELPDLLVLDLGLPDVDGFAVVEWLRRHELLHAMPMVVYTARDLDDSDRRRLRLGPTTQFVTKGRITSSDLEQRVMGLLGRLTPATRRENTDEPEAHPVGR